MNAKKVMRRLLSVAVLIVLAIPVIAQKPTIFDVSSVVVGAQRLETLWFYAAGKWSDAGEHIGPLSTEIHCYKSLGFCEMASAFTTFGEANVSLSSFDILRWDDNEIIAVDSSPICMVNTLRVDLVVKRVTLSSSDKGVAKDPYCKGTDKLPTAVLWGEKEIEQDAVDKASS